MADRISEIAEALTGARLYPLAVADGEVQAGVWYYPRKSWSERFTLLPNDPLLYGFPPPFHPLELLAAHRGWAGKLDNRPSTDAIPALERINAWRTANSFTQGCKGLLPWFPGWPLSRLLILSHLFTPVLTESDPWEDRAKADRVRLYQAIFGPASGKLHAEEVVRNLHAEEVVRKVNRVARGSHLRLWEIVRANGGYDL